MQNPYWVNYRNLRENKKDRYMLGASLNYQILDWLNVSGRVRLDNSNNDYTEKAYEMCIRDRFHMELSLQTSIQEHLI